LKQSRTLPVIQALLVVKNGQIYTKWYFKVGTEDLLMQIKLKKSGLIFSTSHCSNHNFADQNPLWKISVNTIICYSLFSGLALLITK
jgi:hypothetical protein